MSRLYKSYNFKDKDPIIDILRTALQDDNIDWHDLEEFSGVNTKTYYKWFEGDTKSPSTPTLMATLRILPTSTQRLFWKKMAGSMVVEGIGSWSKMLRRVA